MQTEPDCASQPSSCSARVPPVTRLTVCVTAVLSLLSLSPLVRPWLLNSASKSVLQYQVWRLTTASFVGSSLLSAAVMVCVFVLFAPEAERHLGSVRRLIYFLTNCACHAGLTIQVLYAVLSLVVTTLSDYTEQASSGLWGAVVLDSVVLAMRSAEAELHLLGLTLHLRAKYAPILLVVAFQLAGVGGAVWLGLGLGILRERYGRRQAHRHLFRPHRRCD